jgi:hypothetical protein
VLTTMLHVHNGMTTILHVHNGTTRHSRTTMVPLLSRNIDSKLSTSLRAYLELRLTNRVFKLKRAFGEKFYF